MMRYILAPSYRTAALLLAGIGLIAGISVLHLTYPVFLLLLPGYWIATGLSANHWEHLFMAPIFSFIISSALVFVLAFFNAYSSMAAAIILIVANGFSLYSLWNARKRDYPLNEDVAMPRRTSILILCLLLVVGSYVLYALAFSFMRLWSGPYPSFAEMSSFIARTGHMHFLLPNESCYDTTGYFYTPAFTGLFTWIVTFIQTEGQTVAFAFTTVIWFVCFCGLTLAISRRLGWTLEVSLLNLLLLFPSYAVFTVMTQTDSDTPAPACTALFVYALIRLTEKESLGREKWWIVIATLCAYGWWVRMHLGAIYTGTLILLFLFSSDARRSLRLKPAKLAICLLIIAAGPWWEILLWAKTGSPIAPRPLAVGPWKLVMSPAYAHYVVELHKGLRSPISEFIGPRASTLLGHFIYDFFPWQPESSLTHSFVKSARGLIHGNTFSGLWTMAMLYGLAIAALRIRKRGIFSPEGAAILFTACVSLVLVNSYYYKVLYSAIPVFSVFTGLALQDLWIRTKDPALSRTLTASIGSAFLFVFMFSFLWSGVGTWPKERHWGILKIRWNNSRDREWLKVGDERGTALDYLRSLPPDEKLLYFQPEPGDDLNFYLHRQPFWEQYHYDSYRLGGLHHLRSRAAVVRALKAMGIRHIVLTGDLGRYDGAIEPELLPQMLREGDSHLKPVVLSPGENFRIYEIQ